MERVFISRVDLLHETWFCSHLLPSGRSLICLGTRRRERPPPPCLSLSLSASISSLSLCSLHIALLVSWLNLPLGSIPWTPGTRLHLTVVVLFLLQANQLSILAQSVRLGQDGYSNMENTSRQEQVRLRKDRSYAPRKVVLRGKSLLSDNCSKECKKSWVTQTLT